MEHQLIILHRMHPRVVRVDAFKYLQGTANGLKETF